VLEVISERKLARRPLNASGVRLEDPSLYVQARKFFGSCDAAPTAAGEK